MGHLLKALGGVTIPVTIYQLHVKCTWFCPGYKVHATTSQDCYFGLNMLSALD